MPRGGKLKIQWIKEKNPRQASFRKRRVTLFQKARELSVMCSVPAAVLVYGHDDDQPAVWPGVQEVMEILQRHRDLPDALKVRHRLDNEGFVRQGVQKMRRKVDSCKAIARRHEVNLILNDIGLGRPREFGDLPDELINAVVSALDKLGSVTADRVKFLSTEGAQAALPPPLEEEAAALMALQEPPMVPPLAVVAPVVANAPLVLPAPPQSALVVPPPMQQQQEEQQEKEKEKEKPPMVPPPAMAVPMVAKNVLFVQPAPWQSALVVVPPPPPPPKEKEPQLMPPPLAMAAPVVADAPLLLPAPELEPAPPQSELLAAPAPLPPPQVPPMVADAPLPPPAPEPEPQAAAAGVGGDDEPLNLDYEPRDGSFLLEMADAIMDDGTGRLATAEDVDRLLREHGLE